MVKTVEDYLSLPYPIKIEADAHEGGYMVSLPDLPGCITCIESLEGASAAIKDAQREWLTAALEEGIEIPLP